MKVVLVVLLTLLQIVPPFGKGEEITVINDPVFEFFAPSWADKLTLDNVPEDGWKPLLFPHNWFIQQITADEPFNCGYYKGEIEWDGEDLLFLKFPAVNFKARLWVNGKPAGTHLGGYLPFEFNVTDLLMHGKNKVILGVQDVNACLRSGLEIKTPINKHTLPKASIIFPVGSAPHMAGMWIPSEIVRKPRTHIEKVWIDTSVSNHMICVFADVSVPEEGYGAFTAEVVIETLDGRKVLSLPSSEFEVDRNGGRAELSSSWGNPRLWSPESPNLYNAVVRIKKNNTLIDSLTERFGFREFSIRGSDFYLNGTKIYLRACSKHIWPVESHAKDYAQSLIGRVKSMNANALRLHANPFPEEFLDVADEKGLLIINESSAWTMGDRYDLGSDLFWANLKNTWNEHIYRDYNHPSWVIASIENELLLTGGGVYEGVPDRLEQLGEYVKETSNRLIMFEGDDDPNGCADIYNLHYCHEPSTHHTYPQDAYFFDEEFICGSFPAGPYTWNRDKPMYMGEFLWLPEPMYASSVVLGDVSLEDINRYKMEAKTELFDHYVSAFRVQGVSAFNPWNPLEDGELVASATCELYKPTRFFVIQHDNYHFADRTLDRTVYLQNWSEKPKSIDFKWEFAEDSGKWSGIINPSESKVIEISTKTPPVNTQKNLPLKMNMRSDGEIVHKETHEMHIYPYEFSAPKFQLLDINNAFSKELNHAGFSFEVIKEIDGINGDLPVVVAPNALMKDADLFKLNNKYVILFPQDNLDYIPLRTAGVGKLCRNRFQDGFTTTSWVSDFGSWDADELMRFFAGDNIVARDAFKLINGLPCKPMLCAGTGWGQFYPIVDVPTMGVFSTVAIEQKFTSEPRCGEILSELIRYVDDKTNDSNNTPLVSSKASSIMLSVLGFKSGNNIADPCVYYYGKGCKGVDLKELSAESTVILDGVDDSVLDEMGIDIEYKAEPQKPVGMIPLNKQKFPSLTRFMLANACDYNHGRKALLDSILTGEYESPSGMPMVKINARGYDVDFIVMGHLCLLTSDSKPDLIINNLHWERNWNHPLATLLLELGVKSFPSQQITFSLTESKNLVKIIGEETVFMSNSSATGEFYIDSDSDVVLTFLARQDKAGEENAQLRILVDGQLIESIDISSQQYESKQISFRQTQGNHIITFMFVNDLYDQEAGLDRNLWIKAPQLFVTGNN
jgi:hypothetical protein